MIAAALATSLAILAPFAYVVVVASIRSNRRREQWKAEAPGFWRRWRA